MNIALKTILTLLLCAAAASTGAEQLGRLFFTPQQRALLERGQTPETGEPGEAVQPATPDALTVNGIVQKHGGARTVWINGVAQRIDQSDERAPESEQLAIPGQSQPARVKVGQSVTITPAAEPER